MGKSVIYMMTGLPGSGKSSWAKDLVALHKGSMVRVNLDDIRDMLGFGHNGPLTWNKELEESALQIQDKAILTAIAQGKDVIVDNTHLNTKIPTRIKKLFDGDVTFVVQNFTNVSIETCILRDFVRGENGGRSVGEKVIRDMAKQLNRPWRLTAEFMNDYEFPLIPLEYDPELPWVVVFDTDGTTALHNRSPYDYKKVYTDTPDENMCTILRVFHQEAFLTTMGMSGRPDTWQDLTEDWYRDIADVPYDEFHMRAAADRRNDADVKHEMVEKYIRGKYNVLMWFDDRDRVVRRLRKLGIKVAQVAYGDF